MTNEELCERIHAGQDLTEELITNNKGVIYKYARAYYPAAVRNRGLDMDDLLQAANLGLLDAVWRWNRERGTFLTYAQFYMRKEIRLAIGIRSTKKRIENAAPPVSLDEELTDETDTRLVDTIADPNAVDPCEAVTENDPLVAQIINEELGKLPAAQNLVIREHTMNGRPFRKCSVLLGIKEAECQLEEERAFRALRKNKRLRRLCENLDDVCYRHKGIAAFKTSWSSVVEDAAEQREYIRDLMRQNRVEISGQRNLVI